MTEHCSICGQDQWLPRPGRLRDAPDVGVVQCGECGVVVPEQEHPITIDYTSGSMFPGGPPDFAALRARGLTDSTRRIDTLGSSIHGKTVLDVGCGAGGFLSLLDNGVANLGIEVDAAARAYCLASGLEVAGDLEEIPGYRRAEVQVLTLFHVLEHIPDPEPFLQSLLTSLPEVEQIIIEVPSAEDPLLTLLFNEPFSRFTYWSHHSHLHTQRSLTHVLSKVSSNVHVQRVQRYGLPNHLGWLREGQPGGDVRYPWAADPALDDPYRAALLAQGCSDTLWATVSR